MPGLAPGDIVTGIVEQIMPYGAFVRLQNGQKAMIHISQLSHKFIKSVDAVLKLQQEVKASVIKIDERGRIDLSLKALEEPPVSSVPKVPRHVPYSTSAKDSAAGPGDFEKKLSSFLKLSDEKNSQLLSAKNGKGGRSRRKGARP